MDRPDGAESRTSASASTARGAIVLLAEDEPALRALGRRILERHGYQVLEAATGPEALAVARDAGRVDLLVTDVMMPGMQGRELAELMTAAHPGLCVLFVSGYGADMLIDQGVLSEQARVLEKPFAPSSLIARVRELLEHE